MESLLNFLELFDWFDTLVTEAEKQTTEDFLVD